MDNILPTNEYTEVEGRVYSNPQVVLDEANSFIDNLRSTQAQNNQEITQQTQNLGTDISTNLGGLTGADSYFTSRYQTPQTVSAVANLRATAQAAALNEVLANEEAKWKKRYNDAYRKYQKSAYDKANTPANTPATTTEDDDINGGVDENPTDDKSTVIYGGGVTAGPGQQLVMGPDGIVQGYINGEYVEIKPPKSEKNTGSYGMGWSGGGSGGVGGGSGR